jgi:DNA segregation ATPase FtsK/SpoIIIE, S-DNA-T family
MAAASGAERGRAGHPGEVSVILFHRPPRRPGPEMPGGELRLQEPPELPEASGGMSGMLTYAPMALGSLAMVLIFLRPGSGGALSYVAIGLMAVSAVGMVVVQTVRGAGERKRRIRGERRDYLRYLSITRRQVRKAIDQQRRSQLWRHPEPDALWSIVRTSRLWERRTGHPDFGEVRIGLGDQRLGLDLSPLQTRPVEDLEPLSAHALRRFIRAYGSVPDQPVAVYLRAYARVLIQGDEDAARAVGRALLGQLATFHAAEDLRIAIAAEPHAQAAWEWAKWLPHAQHPGETDGAGPVRLITDAAAKLERLLGDDFAGRGPFEPDAAPGRDEPYTVVLLDVGAVPAGSRILTQGYRNTVVIDLRGALEWRQERDTLRLRVTADAIELIGEDRTGKESAAPLGRPDAMTPAAAASLARLIAPYRMSASAETTEPLAADVALTSMLGIADLAAHAADGLWGGRCGADRLRVPLGVAADGSPLELDLKESAEGGMGPHGLLIGATGSGKSELLRTLVLALALTHSSETLNFVLVDFKGGATFLGLDALPHTSAVITNLADEEALVARMKDALHGELIRRQELLRSAGTFRSALDYETARAGGAALAPLPSLVVVVDEFSELLAAHREFMDLFVMIGRLGRSLGVHLLLASQRLDEGRMGQLESHLSYRIGLRTFSAMESRGVLGVPDAYQLPSQPGNGFLKTDTTTLTRFKAAYVSGPYRGARKRVEQAVVARRIVPYSAGYVIPTAPARVEPEPQANDRDAPTLLAVAAGRLRDAGPAAHQVWLPPLLVPPTLDELLPPLAPDSERGLTTLDRVGHGGLAVPVGVIDRPFHQVRDLLVADLSGSGGHVGIAGGPQSGKSTMLRALMAGLALTHTPREVQFYCLDFGGGTLSALAGLPHVGGVTGRLDPERVHRTIIEITSLISRRERLFAEQGVDSMPAFRARRAHGGAAEDRHGDVFLVVDGWGTLRQDFMELLPTFTLIANRGLNYGVHLIVTATRWGEVHSSLRDQLGTRFELRLGDPIDSMIAMRAAAAVPKAPGRGLTDDQAHFLAALPRIDGDGDGASLGAGVADLVDAVADAWPGPKAPPVRMLPLQLDAARLPAPDGDLRLALGVEENELAPFWHDFEQSPHLMVVGDAETGKTNLLRLIARTVAAHYGPDEARVALVDFRRELYGAVPEENRLGYAVSVDVVRGIVDGAARAMSARQPGDDIPPERLRRRDWWTGPRLFLVIDDYEMVGSPSDNLFGPLLDHLAQGTELGLHVIVARSANGAARGMGDPLLRRLAEVNTPALLLSCPPSEGHILGDVKPRQLPPGRAQHITRRRTVQVQTALDGALVPS